MNAARGRDSDLDGKMSQKYRQFLDARKQLDESVCANLACGHFRGQHVDGKRCFGQKLIEAETTSGRKLVQCDCPEFQEKQQS